MDVGVMFVRGMILCALSIHGVAVTNGDDINIVPAEQLMRFEVDVVHRMHLRATRFSAALNALSDRLAQRAADQRLPASQQMLVREAAGLLDWCRQKTAQHVDRAAELYVRALERGGRFAGYTQRALLYVTWECYEAALHMLGRFAEISNLLPAPESIANVAHRRALRAVGQDMREAILVLGHISDWSHEKSMEIREIMRTQADRQFLPAIGVLGAVAGDGVPSEGDPFWQDVEVRRPVGLEFLRDLFDLVPEEHLPAIDEQWAEEGDVCPICQEEFVANDPFLFTLGCRHPVHVGCIARHMYENWRQMNCPYCRQPISRDDFQRMRNLRNDIMHANGS